MKSQRIEDNRSPLAFHGHRRFGDRRSLLSHHDSILHDYESRAHSESLKDLMRTHRPIRHPTTRRREFQVSRLRIETQPATTRTFPQLGRNSVHRVRKTSSRAASGCVVAGMRDPWNEAAANWEQGFRLSRAWRKFAHRPSADKSSDSRDGSHGFQSSLSGILILAGTSLISMPALVRESQTWSRRSSGSLRSAWSSSLRPGFCF